MDTINAAPASCEVRAVIRFLQAKGQSAAEIHRRLCPVCGDNVMSDRCVREWCRKFEDGRTDVHEEGAQGRHSIVTDELVHKVVTLLTEFMAQENTITPDVYCEAPHKLRRSIQNKQCGMLTKGVILLHDNAHPHAADRTNALIKRFNWEIFYHLSYSPDLAPSNYHLFSKMKVWLATQHFHSNEELMDGVKNWLHNLAAPFFDEGLQKLVSRHDKCLNVDGNCVEK
jgi:hypothetical protein